MTAIRTLMAATLAVAAFATPVLAQDMDVIRIGLLGGENEADRLADNQCLIDKLPAALGVKEVQLFPAADYDGVVQGLLGGTLDVAGLGASAYAKVYLADPADFWLKRALGMDEAKHGSLELDAAGFGTLALAAKKDYVSRYGVDSAFRKAAEMVRMIELGVDGLITDYPDRARKVLEERGIVPK